jgi:hypothetical protein
LENAYSRASNEKEKSGVKRTIQWLLDFHISVIEAGIEMAESRAVSDFAGGVSEFFGKMAHQLAGFFVFGIYNEEVVVDEIGKIFNAYYAFLTNKKYIKKAKRRFYPQLLHIYSKVLDSELYSSEIKLLSNSFMRVDQRSLLLCALQEKGVTISLDMLSRFGLSKNDLGQALRILIQNLDKLRFTEKDLKKLLQFAVERNLLNQDEIREDVLAKYIQAFKPSGPNTIPPVFITLVIALFIYIGLVIRGIDVKREAADGFWMILGRYILEIGSSMLSSLYVPCAFLAVAIGIVAVVSSVISKSQKRKFEQKTREFENELDKTS